jgi:hypothetical protein
VKPDDWGKDDLPVARTNGGRGGGTPAPDPDDWGQNDAPVQSPAKPAPLATMSAQPKPAGWGARLSQWAGNAADDLRYGGDTTIVGRGFRAMGGTPLQRDVSPETSEFMASPELGALKAARGAGEMAQSGKRWQGVKDLAGGAAQAAEIPLSFMAPEGVAAGARRIGELVPSAERSGQALSHIESLIGHQPIDVARPGEAALRSFQLAREGNPAPGKPIRDFLARTTAPDRLTAGGAEITHPPLTFGEGRNLYSAGRGKLATDEMTRMNGKQIKALGDFTNDLGTSLRNTATEHGQGEPYTMAMKEYRRAKALEHVGDVAKDIAKKGAVGLVGGGVAGYAAKKAFGH